jgi:hypothetical protein
VRKRKILLRRKEEEERSGSEPKKKRTKDGILSKIEKKEKNSKLERNSSLASPLPFVSHGQLLVFSGGTRERSCILVAV